MIETVFTSQHWTPFNKIGIVVIDLNHGRSLQSSPGSMNDCQTNELIRYLRPTTKRTKWNSELSDNEPKLTLIARAAPWFRSTLSPPEVWTLEPASSNFIRMSCNTLSFPVIEKRRRLWYLFTPTQLWRINCDKETLDATSLCVLYDRLRPRAIFIDVPDPH